MRCDLHVHTYHSGMCTVPGFRRICRESYSEPRAVYELLKERGMDLVTVTDHDSIEAAESLRGQPEFFLSEEVTATSPSGTEVHIGVYDIDERDHIEIQRRRADLMSLIAYLNEHQLFFTVNHAYSSLTGPRTESDFALFARYFPCIEARNGQIPARCNRQAAELAARLGKAVAGGSDAHTLASLGQTYTEVAGARNKNEFLRGLRRGQAIVEGQSGSYRKLTTAAWTLASQMMSDNPWTLFLSPLMIGVPLVTLAHCIHELAFMYKWAPGTCIPRQPELVSVTGWLDAQDYSEAGP